MKAYQIGGGDSFRAAHLALYADACGGIGNAEAGLAAVNDALALAQRTDGRYYEAELCRIKGELLFMQKGKNQRLKDKSQKPASPNPNSQLLDPHSEAEAYFQKAIDIARRQQAKSWELRATVSLARLRQQQATLHTLHNTQHVTRTRLDEAYSMLSNIYNWFSEGFDTRDLQEAKALLEELKEPMTVTHSG
jgi:hypothetical protein